MLARLNHAAVLPNCSHGQRGHLRARLQTVLLPSTGISGSLRWNKSDIWSSAIITSVPRQADEPLMSMNAPVKHAGSK
jgi:hypothetical protein